ncbi:hypothetical protein B0T17DRAFT_621434 [Bombardia bombarda]|uniref:Uncharacterized protein n=1 Tax=Bombardia bombarda TaxID=252184 RepID=A0AA39WBL8_9PEZI|nr:hypothetical protein B0T17DRAFT_621434 [Bombardia bombarda]
MKELCQFYKTLEKELSAVLGDGDQNDPEELNRIMHDMSLSMSMGNFSYMGKKKALYKSYLAVRSLDLDADESDTEPIPLPWELAEDPGGLLFLLHDISDPYILRETQPGQFQFVCPASIYGYDKYKTGEYFPKLKDWGDFVLNKVDPDGDFDKWLFARSDTSGSEDGEATAADG